MYRIGIDAHMLGDYSGGNETYYRNMLENLEAPKGVEIFVFVTEKADITKIKDKFNIVYFSNHSATYRNIIEIPLLCIRYKLDLIHMQYFIPFIRPCSVVVTIHDICFEHFNDIFRRFEYIRQKFLIPYAAKKSKLIVTVSKFSRQDITNCYGIPKDKIIVTYNGVNEEFRPIKEEEIDRDRLKEEYGIEKDYILTVSNLQPRKNIVRLIQAFAMVKQEYSSPLQLVIVGKKAWMYEDIFSEAENIKQDIIFTGYVDNHVLVKIYNGAKFFIYPSIYEGFGLPVIEALACGKKVLISEIASLREIAGDKAIYFNPFSKIDMFNSIISQLKSDVVQNDIDCIKQILSRYSWEESAKLLMLWYMRIIKEKEKI